jgi:hypothetical protein
MRNDTPSVVDHVRRQPISQRSSQAPGVRLPATLLLAILATACGSVEHGDRAPDNRIAAVAWREWTRFGRSTAIHGNQHSVNGYTNRAGVNESSEPLASRISEYWGSCGRPEWNGSRPWSGAFVSWVMSTAGVNQRDFPPNGRHGGYLASLYERQRGGGFALHAPQDYSPKAGDLVCAGTAGASWRNADPRTAKKRIDSTAAHCDVVVDVRGGYVHAVGGNVKNSVTMSLYPIDRNGRLAELSGRPWMLVAQNRSY